MESVQLFQGKATVDGPQKDESLSRPWNHPVILNPGPLNSESSTLTTMPLLHNTNNIVLDKMLKMLTYTDLKMSELRKVIKRVLRSLFSTQGSSISLAYVKHVFLLGIEIHPSKTYEKLDVM